jgi:hypothetical protein
MAARRERERRRPSAERRYRFGTREPIAEPEDLETIVDDDLEAEAVAAQPKRSRSGREGSVATQATVASTRSGTRPAPRPFSDYAAEYAYVYGDLKRIGLVVGSLLLILIVLYLVLPH